MSVQLHDMQFYGSCNYVRKMRSVRRIKLVLPREGWSELLKADFLPFPSVAFVRDGYGLSRQFGVSVAYFASLFALGRFIHASVCRQSCDIHVFF